MDNYDKWWLSYDMKKTGNLFQDCSDIIYENYNVYIDIERFIDYYSKSKLRELVDIHHPRFSTISNDEIIELIVEKDFDQNIPSDFIVEENQKKHYQTNELYWMGWFLTYCKYMSNKSFKDVYEFITFKELRRIYITFHEMDKTTCFHKIFGN